jgi:hypothetical protein
MGKAKSGRVAESLSLRKFLHLTSNDSENAQYAQN